MNQALIVTRNARGTEVSRQVDLEPKAMTDVWFSTPESPLPALAKAQSASGVALAVLEWETDVLKLWAFKDGNLELEYDSSPSFATCTITPPVSTGAGDLAALFGVPERSGAVSRLLSRKKGLGFISESQRLTQLLGLLGATAETQTASTGDGVAGAFPNSQRSVDSST